MLLKKKLCVALAVAAVLLLMLASHSIHRKHFLLLALVPPTPRNVTQDTAPADADVSTPALVSAAALAERLKKDRAGQGARPCACPESCVSDAGASDWFRRRYDLRQRPVLRGADERLDPDALDWWLGLQRSGKEHTLQEVMSAVFQIISPPSADFAPRPRRCRTCAVVGNSGNLRGSGHGDLIDSHAVVIRMNKAVTRGFRRHVGNRTTHHLMYPESAVDLERGVALVLLPFKPRDLEWLASALSTGRVQTTYMRVKERVEADKDKVLVVSPAFFKYVHERWTERHGRYPSTGMLAVVLALHACDQVSVFGYGADQRGNWHHYWEENRYAGAFRKTGVHSADFEMQVIRRLAQEGKIRLHV